LISAALRADGPFASLQITFPNGFGAANGHDSAPACMCGW
jgi:hypothetical protein